MVQPFWLHAGFPSGCFVCSTPGLRWPPAPIRASPEISVQRPRLRACLICWVTLAAPSIDAAWDRVSKEAEFERLMTLHERLVLRTALRLLGRMEDAQDASQEVFLRLYRHLGSVAEEALQSWLYRTTVNVCYDLLRKRPRLAEPGPEPSIAASAQRDLEETAKRQLLEQGLKRLSPQERTALVLCAIEGLSNAEAAQAMGVAEGTVRSHLSLARSRLKEYVGRYWR